ncbi:uncharacterized protein LOC102699568 [Oryza brachyantha]|uniref:uncharacterized protein LOC102699568 n=1 Tax=Oryza brachyantha TaxID=4533 RepID=UPI0003EABCDE|nr:uncharacterized protein LOC102699568 [Oryza brachyantha]
MVRPTETIDVPESSTRLFSLELKLEGFSTIESGQGASASKVAVSSEPATQEVDDSLLNVFDMDEEYVGVDDEGLYMEPIHIIAPGDGVHTSSEPFAQNDQPCGEDGGDTSSAPFAQNAQTCVDDEVTDADPGEYNVIHNPDMPMIEEGAVFPDMITFRKAIRHFAVVKGFEFSNVQTDKTRFIARCKHGECKWRIHASRLDDDKTIHIKKLPFAHECPTTKLMEGKMATQDWIADRLKDWLKKNPDKGAKAAKEKLEEQYEIKLKYSKAWSGKRLAENQIHGTYEDSFQLLFNWKAEIEKRSPGTIVTIDLQKLGKKCVSKGCLLL